MTANEIKALVSLLDDDDKEIVNHVAQKIVSMGEVIIPFLENEWENNFNPNVQKRIEELLHTLQFNTLGNRLQQWKDEDQEDLLKGVWLLATYQYPELAYKQVKKEVDKIYYDAWLSHRSYVSPFDQVKNLNNVFFNKFGFTSNIQNFHAVGNSMINIVLESRRGNPISLCVLYMLVARKLKMPVFGVNLPNLFVLTFKSEEVQFYINVFNKGLVFSRGDIDSYIAQLNLSPIDTFYEPCQNIDILKRILRNMIVSFEKFNEPDKMKEVEHLLSMIEDAQDENQAPLPYDDED